MINKYIDIKVITFYTSLHPVSIVITRAYCTVSYENHSYISGTSSNKSLYRHVQITRRLLRADDKIVRQAISMHYNLCAGICLGESL